MGHRGLSVILERRRRRAFEKLSIGGTGIHDAVTKGKRCKTCFCFGCRSLYDLKGGRDGCGHYHKHLGGVHEETDFSSNKIHGMQEQISYKVHDWHRAIPMAEM